jgi:hypothetical protein
LPFWLILLALYRKVEGDIPRRLAAFLPLIVPFSHCIKISSKFSGRGFCGLPNLTPLALAAAIPSAWRLPYVLPFVFRDKRQNLKNNVTEESPDKILAAACVKQRHVDDADIYALFFGQETPLLKNFGVVPAQAVDTLNIEKVVLFEFADKLFIFWPVEVFAALFIYIEVSFGNSIIIHGNQLPVLMLVLGADADITINASHIL